MKLTILAVIAVSVGAQFVSERRPYEGENLRISGGEPRVKQDFLEEGSRVNHRRMHGSPGDRRAGGFQNGNFAHNDGKLRTNLDYKPTEHPSHNFQPTHDSPYVVEEGAAFRRQDNRQPDVHSSQRRIVEDLYSASDDGNFNGRRQTQSLEQRPRNQNDNEQAHSQREHNSNEKTNARRVSNNQNNQQRNSQSEGQLYLQQTDQNTDYNYQQADVRSSNQNTKQTTVQTKPEINQNSRADSRNNEKPVTNSINNSTATVDQLASVRDKEALDREINNMITKMYFDASVQKDTANTKPSNHKAEPARDNSGKVDDRWIWNMTSTTQNPSVDDRAAFVADQCPSDQVRFNGVCVDKD